MKIVLVIVGAVVALVAIIVTVGATLPRQHVASRTARYRTPADTLWRTLADFPAVRFLSRFVFGQTSTIDGYLRALGRKHGETVTPGPGVAAS